MHLPKAFQVQQQHHRGGWGTQALLEIPKCQTLREANVSSYLSCRLCCAAAYKDLQNLQKAAGETVSSGVQNRFGLVKLWAMPPPMWLPCIL